MAFSFRQFLDRFTRRRPISTASKGFVNTVISWFNEQPELLADICNSGCGGTTDYLFFKSYEAFSAHLNTLQPHTRVILYRFPQLPLRGKVSQELVSTALASIPEGSEFLVVELELTVAGKGQRYAYDGGETHEELTEVLKGRLGRTVAVGLHPRSQNGDSVLVAYVPTTDGEVVPGAY